MGRQPFQDEGGVTAVVLPAQLQAPFLLGQSALVVFLCLAADREAVKEAAVGEVYGPPASLSS
jgi:hypothetical protein